MAEQAAVAAPAAPAAAPVEVGAPLEPNEVFKPFVVGDGLDFEPPPDEQIETEAPAEVEKAKAEAPAVKAERLKEFRNADGTLNEDLLEQVTQSSKDASATVAMVQHAYSTNPAYRLAFIQWRADTGQSLLPEQLAELKASKAKAAEVAAPVVEKPKYKLSTALAAYHKGVAQGASEEDCQKYWDKYVQPVYDAQVTEKITAENKVRDERIAADKKSADDATRFAAYKGEFAEASKAYPDLVVANANFKEGYQVTDGPLLDEMIKIGGTLPIKDKLELALFRLKRTKPVKAAPVQAARPQINAASTRTVAKPAPLEPHMVRKVATIVGDDEE